MMWSQFNRFLVTIWSKIAQNVVYKLNTKLPSTPNRKYQFLKFTFVQKAKLQDLDLSSCFFCFSFPILFFFFFAEH